MTIDIRESRKIEELKAELEYRATMHSAEQSEKDLILEQLEATFNIDRTFAIGLVFIFCGMALSVAMGTTTALMLNSVVGFPLLALGIWSANKRQERTKDRMCRLSEYRKRAARRYRNDMEKASSFGK